MMFFSKLAITAGFLLVLNIGCGSRTQPSSNSDSTLHAVVTDTIAMTKLPAIGSWMMDKDGKPASWLGEKYEGRYLREPINLIIYDRTAKSVLDAKNRLLIALRNAEFPSRVGHSNGYWASIGGKRYDQLDSATFSDCVFELDNNHGRIFGPCLYASGYLWIGAFSREKVTPFSKIKHQYVSFNQSRDAISHNLDTGSFFHRASFINLGNTFVNRSDTTTGDHDGIAVVLESK